MQAKRKTQPYDTFELFDGSCEVPMNMEYDMPDYCADIQKYSSAGWCQSSPPTRSQQDVLRCEGVCDVRVLYLTPRGTA